MTQEIVKHARATGNNINSLRAQRDAFEALRRSVDVTGDEFKRATAEVARLDQQLAKIEGRKATVPGRGGMVARHKLLGLLQVLAFLAAQRALPVLH